MQSTGVIASKIEQPLTLEPSDRMFIRAAYVDLTGRTPLPQEWQDAVGKTRGQFVQQLAHSLEFFEGWYERELFYFLLIDQFRPSTNSFAKIPQSLASKSMSVKQCLRALVSSQFFNQRNPGNDTFVTVVLEQLLGMTVQKEIATLESGKKMYDGQSVRFLGQRGRSQADLVRIVMEDERFETAFLQRQYQQLVGRKLASDDLRSAASRLRQDPDLFSELVIEWLSSQPYEEATQSLRAKDDQVFIRSLFVDLMGRTPDYQEARRCRNALLALSDSGPLRSVVVKLMLDSESGWNWQDTQDAETQVRELFLRFLCRVPTADELQTFVAAIQAGTSIRTVLRALLTHWEYQHY